MSAWLLLGVVFHAIALLFGQMSTRQFLTRQLTCQTDASAEMACTSLVSRAQTRLIQLAWIIMKPVSIAIESQQVVILVLSVASSRMDKVTLYSRHDFARAASRKTTAPLLGRLLT
jgi:hypothetical protein